jgi:hypothetical protein
MSNPCEPPQEDPVEAWKARWPNHCKACGGWGVFQEAATETGEVTLTLCDALPAGTCHRCGDPQGIDLDDETHPQCRSCGWNYDDGVPAVEEPGKEV